MKTKSPSFATGCPVGNPFHVVHVEFKNAGQKGKKKADTKASPEIVAAQALLPLNSNSVSPLNNQRVCKIPAETLQDLIRFYKSLNRLDMVAHYEKEYQKLMEKPSEKDKSAS